MPGLGPLPSSTRRPNRGLGTRPLFRLPDAGRPGRAPRWPLDGKPPKVWSELWHMPQAVAWEQLHLHRVVARYAILLAAAEQPGAPASLLGEVRQLEDRLGLSAVALLRLRWEIVADPVDPPAGVTRLDDRRFG